MTVFLALLLGGFFGFALHRAGASHGDNILRMLTLRDLYLAKAIVFAIGMTSLFAWIAVPLGLLDPGHFSVKPTHLGVLLGGLIFGVGFALAAYCPGTALAALGRVPQPFEVPFFETVDGEPRADDLESWLERNDLSTIFEA